MKSKTKERTCVAVTALAVIGALVFCLFRSTVVEATYPAERLATGVFRSVTAWVRGAFAGARMAAENQALRRELAGAQLLKADVRRLERENARLRTALGYAEARGGEWLPAGVLSARGGAAAVRRTLRLDKGSADGVTVGAAVAVPEGLVGKVESVSAHTASVLLVTDPALKVACEAAVPGGGFMRGILLGGDGHKLVLGYLSNAAEVPPGTMVFSSGLGGVFPRGLAVGALQVPKTDASGVPAPTREVSTEVDFSALEDVFIRRER